jgi:hypothetical protein
MRLSTIRSLFLALFATSIAACGGGSSPTGGCRRAAAPTSGPGDTLAYFPAEVGRSWQYQETSGGTVTTTVTGTQPVGTETATVFTTSSTADPTPSPELLVKRPWGVYVLDDGTAAPVIAQTLPELIIPFPVVVSPATELVSCTSLDAGDLDQDGRGDRADLVETLAVVSISETAVVPAGTFTSVAHLRKDLSMTVRSTSSGSLTIVASQDDWYAPGVGRVRMTLTVTIVGGPTSSDTIQLVSFTTPAPRLVSPAPVADATTPPARMAARLSAPDSFEAAARRLAAALLAGPR